MRSRAHWLVCALALLDVSAGRLPAEGQWVRARLGPFEAISDEGRAASVQALSQFEQFRYALGAAMGQPDLRLSPGVRVIVFHDPREMAAQGCDGIRMGRDHLMACGAATGQLAPAMVRQLTRRLLESNFTGIPLATEQALETFFSTVESNAVHVTWGAPPPAAERTRDWALLHRLITQPDTSGRAHIYLHNLATGMDTNGAIRSMGEDVIKFNSDIDRYMEAGVYQAVAAPNRPLNPDRDFNTANLTAEEGQLARADLLGPGAESIYAAILKSGKHLAEANEGLGFIALRAGDEEKARSYFEAAKDAGSRNVLALTAYGKMQKNYADAMVTLKAALAIDAKYAPAHWELGDKLDDPARRLAEWKQALQLDPHNTAWWVTYARLNEGQKQYAEAGRAWVAAGQSTSDLAQREEYMRARGAIEQLRLDDEAAERRRQAADKTAEIDRLKAEARKQLADLEARTNAQLPRKNDGAPIVDWADTDESKSAELTGMLTKVDCAGKQFRLAVKDAGGAIQQLLITDLKRVSVKGEALKFTCGAQKPRKVLIHYLPSTAAGITGEIIAFEYR